MRPWGEGGASVWPSTTPLEETTNSKTEGSVRSAVGFFVFLFMVLSFLVLFCTAHALYARETKAHDELERNAACLIQLQSSVLGLFTTNFSTINLAGLKSRLESFDQTLDCAIPSGAETSLKNQTSQALSAVMFLMRSASLSAAENLNTTGPASFLTIWSAIRPKVADFIQNVFQISDLLNQKDSENHVSSASMELMLFILAICSLGLQAALLFGSRRSGLRATKLAARLSKQNEQMLKFAASEKKLVRVEEERRARSQFLSTMSHEIRTPINGIVGMSSLLRNTLMSEEQTEFVETISACSSALLTLVDNVLDFSALDRAIDSEYAFPLREDTVVLSTLMDSISGIFRAEASRKGVTLQYLCDSGLPEKILTDGYRLKQMISNLVENGLKFTSAGTVSFRVERDHTIPAEHSFEFNRETHVALHIFVKDTGLGIPADKFDSIFQSFSQLDTSHSRKYGGVGLGLSIVSRLAKLMHGSVWMESEEGKGSTFHLALPVKLCAPDAFHEVMQSTQSDSAESAASPVAPLGSMWSKIPSGSPGQISPQHLRIASIRCRGAQPKSLLFINPTKKFGDFKLAAMYLGCNDVQLNPFHLALISVGKLSEDSSDECLEMVKTLRSSPAHAQLPIIFTLPEELSGRQLFYLDAVLSLHRVVAIRESEGVLIPNIARTLATLPSNSLSVSVGEVHPLNILVVDDDALNRKVLVNILRKLGYSQITVVEDGRQAVDATITAVEKESPFDAILMDFQMPVLDGIAATREIVAFPFPSGFFPPRIYVISASVDVDMAVETVKAGAECFIGKPYVVHRLCSALISIPSRNQVIPSIPEPATLALNLRMPPLRNLPHMRPRPLPDDVPPKTNFPSPDPVSRQPPSPMNDSPEISSRRSSASFHAAFGEPLPVVAFDSTGSALHMGSTFDTLPGSTYSPYATADFFKTTTVIPRTYSGIFRTDLNIRLRKNIASLSILIAEDNPVNAKVLMRMLEVIGCTKIAVRENGLLAVDSVLEAVVMGTPYDLIFMDMQMPVMDGLEATRLIRRSSNKLVSECPIVCVTANTSQFSREECIDAGMSGFVSKPIDVEIIKRVMSQLVQPSE